MTNCQTEGRRKRSADPFEQLLIENYQGPQKDYSQVISASKVSYLSSSLRFQLHVLIIVNIYLLKGAILPKISC